MIKAEWTNADALDLQPTCNQLATDCISRRVAIDAIHYADTQIYDGEAAVGRRNYMTKNECCEIIDSLPPARSEIVRCVDCVHSDTFPKGADNDMPLKCLGIRYGGVMPDWYCEHAERRTDE